MAETMAVLGSGLFVDEPLLFKLLHRPLSVFDVHNVISQKNAACFPPADFHHHALGNAGPAKIAGG